MKTTHPTHAATYIVSRHRLVKLQDMTALKRLQRPFASHAATRYLNMDVHGEERRPRVVILFALAHTARDTPTNRRNVVDVAVGHYTLGGQDQ